MRGGVAQFLEFCLRYACLSLCESLDRGSTSTRTWNDPHIALARERERDSHLSHTFSVSAACGVCVCVRACVCVLVCGVWMDERGWTCSLHLERVEVMTNNETNKDEGTEKANKQSTC